LENVVSDNRYPLAKVQLDLPLFIAKEVEIDGIGMGVLSDGTAYLSTPERMCIGEPE
jgi:hypothetical protein